ncbi:hypothetical protein L6164_006979 [Bauhinia variegata]|uniref:Uncharacterized protein n=1 Tax=Bauhinia variegata TaxID=167791 RepID=A0ACB9PW83_BAUVA|nr:hypothetical protein L6164_006979 [Bauhinia variegata]
MGCVQTKAEDGSVPKGLEKLKLENGYVGNAGFAAHRRSTGQRYERRESGRQSQLEARKKKVEFAKGNGNDGGQGDGLDGFGGIAGGGDEGRLNKREGKRRDRVQKGGNLSNKSLDDEMVDGWPKWLVDNIPKEVLAGLVPKSAESYKMIDKVGQGTYSNVYKARDRETREIVALKKVRFDTSEPESIKFMAREIMILQRLDHPNVVKLKGLATSRMQYSLYLVFDFMQTDLARIITRPEERLTEPQVKSYMHQLLSGLQHCHDRGILHRDIKGSNLLIDRNGMLKIADFGLANFYSPESNQPLTSRVVTLWYRAPELLLGATAYGVGIDLWSAGCLLAEMFTGIPIMPGRTEVEQLHRIFRLCGTPSEEYWKKLRLSTTFRPPRSYRPSLVETFKPLPQSCLGLLCNLLALDPAYRGTASKALQNEFFFTSPLACDLSGLPVIYREDDEQDQASEQIKRMNAKIRRSCTLRERRRKNQASGSPVAPAASPKEELRVEEETCFPSITTTSSTSSSVNQAVTKDESLLLLPSQVPSSQKQSPKIHYLANGGEHARNLPPLLKSKAAATKKDENRYRLKQVQRSTSTREFTNFRTGEAFSP